MKRIHYIGIIIVLLVLIGIFLISPFSPLNKTSVGGHAIDLPSGYTVQNSSKSVLSISNGTNDLTIYAMHSTDTQEAIKTYHEKHDDRFEINETDLTVGNEKVKKTTAKLINGTTVIDGYWFINNGEVYTIQTKNPDSETENVITSMISSF